MTALFYDTQDRENPMNGAELHSGDDARRLINELGGRAPFFAELIGENGCKLLLGIAPNDACVQFSPADGSPPYMMASVGYVPESVDDHVEYLIDDTAAPVPRRFCVPHATMVHIAAYFVECGERYEGVSWVDI